MQKDPFTPQATKPATHDFDHLTETLKAAVAKFQDDQSPENFAGIVSALTAFGISGADLWQKVAAYAKVHPVRVAFGAGVLFYAMKGILGESRAREAYH
jgi:hypothetical protein